VGLTEISKRCVARFLASIRTAASAIVTFSFFTLGFLGFLTSLLAWGSGLVRVVGVGLLLERRRWTG
jgi:membrane-bound ClpP family serine protease